MSLHRHLPLAIIVAASVLRLALARPEAQFPRLESSISAPEATTLPNMNCGSTYSPQWNGCVGVVQSPNGNIYRGEFVHGMREGFGFIEINAKGVSDPHNILSDEPAIYAGEFRRNALNGHGVWFTTAGSGFSGTFIDNIPKTQSLRKNCDGAPSSSWSNCVARIAYGNGNVYYGEFMHGQRDGVGMLEIHSIGVSDETSIRTPAAGVYVGGFAGDRLNGRGMIFMPSAGLFGTFKNNIFVGSKPGASLEYPLNSPETLVAQFLTGNHR